MKRVTAGLTVLVIAITIIFSSCGNSREFIPAETTEKPSTTAAETTTGVALDENKFNFGKIQMGMNTEAVQVAIGQASTVYSRNGKYYFTNGYKGIAGIDKNVEKTVYFIFGLGNNLEEIQYVVDEADGITYEQMVELFKKQFGKYVSYKNSSGKQEAIWQYKDVYVVVTKDGDNNKGTVVSYFEKTVFETEYKDEVDAFRKG